MIERAPLLAQLDEARFGRISILQAPSGYGKSTLLSAWTRKLQREGVDVASMEVDEDCADPDHFLDSLTAAINDRGLVNGSVAKQRNAQPADSTRRSSIRRFGELLKSHDKPLVIIVDNYDTASHDELDAFFGELLRSVPANVHFAVATRTQFLVPLRELWLASNAHEFAAEHLRFTDDEIAALFDNGLQSESLAQISAWTEGWPVAVGLARHYLSITHSGNDRLDELLAGIPGDINRYLMDQMIQRLPYQNRELLIQTSFLEAFSDELAEAVTGMAAARSLLQELEQSNVLITPMDETGTWYQCHQLLRTVLLGLLRRRGSRAMAELQLRASHWYRDAGNFRKAIRHARDAAQHDEVVRLVLQAGGIFYGLRFGGVALKALLDQLPPELFSEYPRLNLARSFVLQKEGRFDIANDIIRSVKEKVGRSATERGDKDPALPLDLAFAELSNSLHCGLYPNNADMKTIELAALEAPAEDFWLRGLLHNLISLTKYRQSDFGAALSAGQSALYYFAQAGSLNNQGYIHLWLGHVHIELGEVELAKQNYQAARDALLRTDDETGCAAVDVALAEALYEQGQLDEAKKLVVRAIDTIETSENYYELLVAGYQTWAGLSFLNQGAQDAGRLLKRAIASMRRRGFIEVERFLILHRLELELLSGDDLGGGVLTTPNLPLDDNLPTSWREDDLKVFINARLVAQQGDLDQAAKSLENFVDMLDGAGRQRTRIIAFIELALIYEGLGYQSKALGALHQAIILALPGEVLRPFFLRGAQLTMLLFKLITDNGLCNADDREVDFVKKIIRVFNDLDSTQVSLFSSREQEIVRLLVAGMSNKLIARELKIAPDTVRFHLKKIYEKFGVNDRKLVANMARERQILE